MENLVILFRNKFFKLYETKESIWEQTDDYIRYCTRYNFVKNRKIWPRWLACVVKMLIIYQYDSSSMGCIEMGQTIRLSAS